MQFTSNNVRELKAYLDRIVAMMAGVNHSVGSLNPLHIQEKVKQASQFIEYMLDLQPEYVSKRVLEERLKDLEHDNAELRDLNFEAEERAKAEHQGHERTKASFREAVQTLQEIGGAIGAEVFTPYDRLPALVSEILQIAPSPVAINELVSANQGLQAEVKSLQAKLESWEIEAKRTAKILADTVGALRAKGSRVSESNLVTHVGWIAERLGVQEKQIREHQNQRVLLDAANQLNAIQDNWVKNISRWFSPDGTERKGFPQIEADIHRVLAERRSAMERRDSAIEEVAASQDLQAQVNRKDDILRRIARAAGADGAANSVLPATVEGLTEAKRQNIRTIEHLRESQAGLMKEIEAVRHLLANSVPALYYGGRTGHTEDAVAAVVGAMREARATSDAKMAERDGMKALLEAIATTTNYTGPLSGLPECVATHLGGGVSRERAALNDKVSSFESQLKYRYGSSTEKWQFGRALNRHLEDFEKDRKILNAIQALFGAKEVEGYSQLPELVSRVMATHDKSELAAAQRELGVLREELASAKLEAAGRKHFITSSGQANLRRLLLEAGIDGKIASGGLYQALSVGLEEAVKGRRIITRLIESLGLYEKELKEKGWYSGAPYPAQEVHADQLPGRVERVVRDILYIKGRWELLHNEAQAMADIMVEHGAKKNGSFDVKANWLRAALRRADKGNRYMKMFQDFHEVMDRFDIPRGNFPERLQRLRDLLADQTKEGWAAHWFNVNNEITSLLNQVPTDRGGYDVLSNLEKVKLVVANHKRYQEALDAARIVVGKIPNTWGVTGNQGLVETIHAMRNALIAQAGFKEVQQAHDALTSMEVGNSWMTLVARIKSLKVKR